MARARTLLGQLPDTAGATRARAKATTSALQVLPDSTLNGLAASSLGLGAGFYLAGASRLKTALAMAPAMVLGAAVLLRPAEPAAATSTAG